MMYNYYNPVKLPPNTILLIKKTDNEVIVRFKYNAHYLRLRSIQITSLTAELKDS